jgi:hypothetical protein
MLNLKDLQTFAVVADAGDVSPTARRIGISNRSSAEARFASKAIRDV